MYRVAFVHSSGLSTGGTERFMQTIAANLPKDSFEVDYYYAGKVAEHRKEYLLEHNVNIIEFHFKKSKTKMGYTYFTNCDFSKVFRNNYDLVQAGRSGIPDSCFDSIRKTPIVDSIHYVSGVDNKYNIARVMHISNFSKNMWIKKGGDKSRTVMISLPLFIPEFKYTDIREQLGLNEDCFLFGFHQANRDDIFSDIPLRAYKEVENNNNAFIICNGSRLYREQAKELGLKNVYFFDYIANDDEFYSVIKSLDVYAHGRKDGELNSAAIAEALNFGLPVITHPSSYFNGHLEIVTSNGFVANDYKKYAEYMKMLEENEELRNKCSEESFKIFEKKYNFSEQMKNIVDIYRNVIKEPFPNKNHRRILDIKQRIKNFLKKIIVVFIITD